MNAPRTTAEINGNVSAEQQPLPLRSMRRILGFLGGEYQRGLKPGEKLCAVNANMNAFPRELLKQEYPFPFELHTGKDEDNVSTRWFDIPSHYDFSLNNNEDNHTVDMATLLGELPNIRSYMLHMLNNEQRYLEKSNLWVRVKALDRSGIEHQFSIGLIRNAPTIRFRPFVESDYSSYHRPIYLGFLLKDKPEAEQDNTQTEV